MGKFGQTNVYVMALRPVVAGCYAGACAVVGLVLAGFYWWRGSLPSGLEVAGIAGAAAFGGWLVLDRLLVKRERHEMHLPARPEFYDFEMFNQPMHMEELGGKALKDLTFVVFDTETTGLEPSRGDEMISIGGVKVADGQVQAGQSFDRLINPGRHIPKRSIRFHGITDDMVKEAPGAGPVLADFKAFAGDAVLVAHNAAFDMKFLKLKEASTGVVFDNIVLDSLLLSVFLHNDTAHHSLDAIAERYMVDVQGRHTALGDSMVTAHVLLGMLDQLQARGIKTLFQAIEASKKMVHVRKMQERF